MLVLEDIHWADPDTLAIVQYLADNLAGKRVLCVATLRDSEPSAGLDTVRSIHARRAAPVIEVPRLAEPEVARLAACCLGTDVTSVPDAVGAQAARRLRRAAVRRRGDPGGRALLRPAQARARTAGVVDDDHHHGGPGVDTSDRCATGSPRSARR